MKNVLFRLYKYIKIILNMSKNLTLFVFFNNRLQNTNK